MGVTTVARWVGWSDDVWAEWKAWTKAALRGAPMVCESVASTAVSRVATMADELVLRMGGSMGVTKAVCLACLTVAWKVLG